MPGESLKAASWSAEWPDGASIANDFQSRSLVVRPATDHRSASWSLLLPRQQTITKVRLVKPHPRSHLRLVDEFPEQGFFTGIRHIKQTNDLHDQFRFAPAEVAPQAVGLPVVFGGNTLRPQKDAGGFTTLLERCRGGAAFGWPQLVTRSSKRSEQNFDVTLI